MTDKKPLSLGKKLLSPLRNAFSYAIHLESASDHERKPASVAKLLAASLPAPEGADDDYEARLQAVLMKTRTKHLDVLLANDVRVVLDGRLPQQKLEVGDRRIDGIFYDEPGAKTVALWDDGAKHAGWTHETPAFHAPTMLERLADCLKAGGKGDMYASRFTYVDHAPGIGMAGVVTYTDWATPEHFEPGAIQKNPALSAPLAKRPEKPKP